MTRLCRARGPPPTVKSRELHESKNLAEVDANGVVSGHFQIENRVLTANDGSILGVGSRIVTIQNGPKYIYLSRLRDGLSTKKQCIIFYVSLGCGLIKAYLADSFRDLISEPYHD